MPSALVVSGPAPAVKMHEPTRDLTVRRRTTAADDVVILDLTDPHGDDLSAWEPGAHIDLLLGEGLVRQYSLCGDPHDSTVWRIGVLLDPHGRGGSRHVHEHLQQAMTVQVRGPRNHFPLVSSPRYLFIAGGIGITPIAPMVNRAQQAGSDWTLIYLGRSRTTMAFATQLAGTYGEHVKLWPRDEKGRFDLEAALKDPQDHTLVYCCGPEELVSVVEHNCRNWPDGSLHDERFAAKPPAAGTDARALESFQVLCQRSGLRVDVPADVPILEALEDAGILMMSACLEGICGTCEATVLAGTPDHRDSILTDAERTSGDIILTCVSRSHSKTLVLDL
jgi:ferredoxin-NADP reductase